MKRTFALVLTVVMGLGLTAGAVLAQNPGLGHGPPQHPQEPTPELSVISGEETEHVDASPS